MVLESSLRGRVDERKGRRNCLDARNEVDLGKTEADIKREREKTRLDVNREGTTTRRSFKQAAEALWRGLWFGRAAGRSAREY